MPPLTDSMVTAAPGRVDRRKWARPEDTECEDGYLHNLLGLTEGRGPNDPESDFPPHPTGKPPSLSSSNTDEEDAFSYDNLDMDDVYINHTYITEADNSSDNDGSNAFTSERCIV